MDFLFDDDIVINEGDLVTGENTESHAEFIIIASKGNFFWNPTLGYGINGKINSNIEPVQLQGEIRDELRKERIVAIGDIDSEGNELNLSVQNEL